MKNAESSKEKIFPEIGKKEGEISVVWTITARISTSSVLLFVKRGTSDNFT